MTRIQSKPVQTPTTTPVGRYRVSEPAMVPGCTWPAERITKAPRWLSTDLRDGNQALISPMTPNHRIRMFGLFVAPDCKGIEIGFPSASRIDFDFIRQFITNGHVPEDVTVSVLTQAWKDLITRTAKSLIGTYRATIHMHSTTAELFRRVVFGIDEIECVNLTTRDTELVTRYAGKYLGKVEFGYQYDPKIFTRAPTGFAVEVRNAIAEIQQPDKNREVIFNPPVTVECSTPNAYADQIEHFCRNIDNREFVVISLHPRSGRGAAIAAVKLSQMAGADQVEGCLFGHDERTGNVDLAVLALNLYTQSIDPQLDFHNIDHARRIVEYCTGLPMRPRQPCTKDLMYTVFSESHQNAIKEDLKSLEKQAAGTGKPIIETEWEAPYLPTDLHDVGRNYEAMIRVNSQPGKGGVTYLMKTEAKVELPCCPQMEFSRIVQQRTDTQSGEFSPKDIVDIFLTECLSEGDWVLTSAGSSSQNGQFRTTATINDPKDYDVNVEGGSNGPVSTFVDALAETGTRVRVLDYSEYVLRSGGGTRATAHMERGLDIGDNVQVFRGVGVDPSVTSAPTRAILPVLSRVACA